MSTTNFKLTLIKGTVCRITLSDEAQCCHDFMRFVFVLIRHRLFPISNNALISFQELLEVTWRPSRSPEASSVFRSPCGDGVRLFSAAGSVAARIDVSGASDS